MGGGIASTLLGAARASGRHGRGDRAVRGRRVLARAHGRPAAAAPARAGQPVPRPARPLRRAGDDRRPLGGAGRATSPSATWASCSTPTIRWSPTWGETGRGSCISASRTTRVALAGMAHAADAKHCRRCGGPYTFDVVYLGHLGRYHCPRCGQTRPVPAVAAEDVTLRGVHAARFTLRLPHAQRRRRAAPARPLQRLQRHGGGGPGSRARDPTADDRGRPAGRRGRVRARRDA